MVEAASHQHHDTMDSSLKADIHKRLKAAEGQVGGLMRMVDDGRYCVDILTQISSVHEALRAVGKLVFRNHLETCVTDDLQSGSPERISQQYDELSAIAYRLAK